jgi:uncharacterized membrane protein
MRIESILLLIISCMLIIVSSWTVSIFKRLKDLSPQYKTHMSDDYIKKGTIMSVIVLIISFILLIVSSVNIYLH